MLNLVLLVPIVLELLGARQIILPCGVSVTDTMSARASTHNFTILETGLKVLYGMLHFYLLFPKSSMNGTRFGTDVPYLLALSISLFRLHTKIDLSSRRSRGST